MASFNSEQLLAELGEQTNSISTMVEQWKGLSSELLNRQPQIGKWSALQCLEHLNIYGNYYLPAIETGIKRSNTLPNAIFNSGWIGNYFAETIKPQKNGIPKNTMSAMKAYIPDNQLDKEQVITEFLLQQKQLSELLANAKKINIEKVKIPISLNRFIKIRLGDCFRFVIYHNERHFQQALRAMQ